MGAPNIFKFGKICGLMVAQERDDELIKMKFSTDELHNAGAVWRAELSERLGHASPQNSKSGMCSYCWFCNDSALLTISSYGRPTE